MTNVQPRGPTSRQSGVLSIAAVAILAINAACATPTSPAAAVAPSADRPMGGGAAGGPAAMAPIHSASAEKTLTIGIANEVKGFSELNGNQNKYVEDLLVGNLFLNDEQGVWHPAL